MSFFDRLNTPVLGSGRRLPAARWRIVATLVALLVLGGGLLLFLAPPPLCRTAAPITGHSPEGAYHVYFRPGADVEVYMARARERYGVETVTARRSMSRVALVASRRQITRLRCDPDVERIEAL